MADGDILLLDSFDRYAPSGSIGRMNAIWSSNLGIVTGRYFGGKGVKNSSNNNGGALTLAYTNERVQAFTFGCAVKPDSRAWSPMMSARGPNGTITIGYEDNGRLVAVNGTYGALGYNADKLYGDGLIVESIIQDIWQYVEFQVVLETGTPLGSIKAWVNGELCMDLPDLTLNKTGGFDGFGFMVRQNGISYDDMYVREGGERLGEIKIESSIPDGTFSNTLPGLVGALTAHEAVNESPVDGDTSYVSGVNVGQGIRYTMGNLTQVPNAIKAVQVRALARKDETAYRSIKNAISVFGVEAEGKEHVLGTGYKFFRDIFPLDPSTGTPWTNTAIDAFLCGVDIHA